MSNFDSEVSEQKRLEEDARGTIVRHTLIETADHNYLLARQAFRLSSGPDFWWLSLHAIEKYLKATLLLNGYGARSFGHDVRKLYHEVHNKLPFIPYADPAPFDYVESIPTELKQAIGYIYALGSPPNRYDEAGVQLSTPDLFLVDQVVLTIRAGCRSFRRFDGEAQDYVVVPVRNWSFDWHLDEHLPLEKAEHAAEGIAARDILMRQNIVFDPDLPKRLDRALMTTSPFFNVLKALREHPDSPPSWAKGAAEWAIANMHLGPDMEKQLSNPDYRGDPETAKHRVFSMLFEVGS